MGKKINFKLIAIAMLIASKMEASETGTGVFDLEGQKASDASRFLINAKTDFLEGQERLNFANNLVDLGSDYANNAQEAYSSIIESGSCDFCYRVGAAKGLYRLNESHQEQALGYLRGFQGLENPNSKLQASEALIELGHISDALPALSIIMQDMNALHYIRSRAVGALAKFGGDLYRQPAGECLLGLIRDETGYHESQTGNIKALIQLGGEWAQAAERILLDPDSAFSKDSCTVEFLIRLGKAEDSKDDLIKLSLDIINNDSLYLSDRMRAMKSLLLLDVEKRAYAESLLLDVMNNADLDYGYRIHAAVSLIKIGEESTERAMNFLLDLSKTTIDDLTDFYMVDALDTIKQCSPERVMPALNRMLQSYKNRDSLSSYVLFGFDRW